MNMGFQKLHGTELQLVRSASRELPSYIAVDTSSAPRASLLKYLLWSVAGLGVAYLFITASATMQLVVAAGFIVLLAIATAVCIYAQNNSRY